jgi:RND family efflux transporter MFP subunit
VPEFTLVGTVTAIRRSVVGSPVDGRVTEINVEAGDLVASDNVEAGLSSAKPIVQLSTETVGVEIAAATADLTRLEHELDELRAGSRPEEISRAKAHWEAAKAANELAEARLKRAEDLSRSNAVSADELETAKSVAQTAKQSLIAGQADYELVNAGPRRQQISQSVAKVEQQKQEIARLNILRSYHAVHAPFAGFVVQKHTEVGQWLSRGDPVAEIVSLDPIDVVVHVPESLVNELKTGDTVPLHVAALPDGLETLEGTIHGIGPSADQRARTFPVRVRLRNPERDGGYLLRDGMQARATISGTPRSTLIVPKDALVLGGQTPVVMVASTAGDGQTIASKVDVETGIARESTVEVRGDIQAGLHVIVDGNERVRSGEAVRVVNDISENGSDNEDFTNTAG